ncbi:16119_t:CDS:2, partial [Dentiscutata heterogama]
EIINDSTFWTDLKELDEILLPFCATLNKLQYESKQPLLILSWLLHPSYSLKKLNVHLNGLLALMLGKYVVYYYTNWFSFFIEYETYKELANLALHLFEICINSASVERLFLTMGFFYN